ncbi:MAG TPA: DUF2806 domain-containing protein [Flavobacterium sp.]|nr:DUF2806 domain-containing protein [Flavobacterium sp.]
MAEINIIKIDGKPLEKLIDVISKGVGTIYRPKAIRKEADAKAYEIEIIERAKSKALAEGKEIDADTYERIQERILHKETKRQNNIDNVSQIAAEQLGQEQTVSDEPVDEDWTSRFFNIVEDVSDEEMQQLWGRILAGEVKQPKSYSLRTLELLKNLSKREAEVFSRASNFVISSYNSPFLFKGKNSETLDKHNLTFEDRLLLTETGILQAENTISRQLKQTTSDSLFYFESGRYIIKVLKKANTLENGIEILRFTKIGEELLKLLSPNPTEGYIKDFCLRLEEFGLEVKYAFILVKNFDGTISHTQPWMKFNKE